MNPSAPTIKGLILTSCVLTSTYPPLLLRTQRGCLNSREELRLLRGMNYIYIYRYKIKEKFRLSTSKFVHDVANCFY
jgi:hypothetical protein